LNKWFETNLLSLNYDKTYFIQFRNKITYASDIRITYGDKQIFNTLNTKFLGLFINGILSWKTHIENIMSELSSACCAMRSVKPHVTEYFKNYLLFLLLLFYDLWVIVLGAFPIQCKNLQVAKENN
jgi:hypothetical protein